MNVNAFYTSKKTRSVTLCSLIWKQMPLRKVFFRGGSRTVATSKMERFVIIVNGFKPLTIITKRYILDVAAVLDPPLIFDAIIGMLLN